MASKLREKDKHSVSCTKSTSMEASIQKDSRDVELCVPNMGSECKALNMTGLKGFCLKHDWLEVGQMPRYDGLRTGGL